MTAVLAVNSRRIRVVRCGGGLPSASAAGPIGSCKATMGSP